MQTSTSSSSPKLGASAIVRLAAVPAMLVFAACIDAPDQGPSVPDVTERDLRIAPARDNGVSEPKIAIEREHLSATGFTYVVSRGRAAVTLTVTRHGLRHQADLADPKIDGPYDADVVLRNRHGFPFLTSGDGASLMTASERDLSVMRGRTFLQDEQLEDLALVVDAAELLDKRPAVGATFPWEIRRLRSMAEFALENANSVLDGTAVPAPTPDLRAAGADLIGLVPFGGANGLPPSTANASTYIHQVMIRRASCCWSFGQHSAVLLNIFYSNGTFIASVSTQNHGREATDPTMTTAAYCPKTYYGRTAAFPTFQPYSGSDLISGIWGDAGGCATPYGLTSGKHVCNDDSQAEYNNIKYNVAGIWSFCGDAVLASNAPYCN